MTKNSFSKSLNDVKENGNLLNKGSTLSKVESQNL